MFRSMHLIKMLLHNLNMLFLYIRVSFNTLFLYMGVSYATPISKLLVVVVLSDGCIERSCLRFGLFPASICFQGYIGVVNDNQLHTIKSVKVKSRSYSRAYIDFKRLDDDIEFVEFFTGMFLLIRWLYLSEVTTYNQITSYY